MTFALLLAAAYVVGSVPFALVSSRLFRLADPRSYGSGNPGATNVLRSGNKSAAALTLLGDCAKGWVVVLTATALGCSAAEAAAAGLFALLGHIFSVFLRFKGGKGVATALGVLAGIDPWLALISALVWLGVALASRYSSAAALSAAAIAPVATLILTPERGVFGAVLAMTGILVWRHKDNIARLKNGTESRIGGGKL